jgi:predicted FMN-binding regulatory protein PaiB
MRAERIYAKAKLSQNRTDADRIRVIRQLSESADVLERECAEDMRRSLGR